jgi:hypothetical protein
VEVIGTLEQRGDANSERRRPAADQDDGVDTVERLLPRAIGASTSNSQRPTPKTKITRPTWELGAGSWEFVEAPTVS